MPLSFDISDGTVEIMGDGMVLVLQNSHEGMKDVALTRDDLRAMLAALEA